MLSSAFANDLPDVDFSRYASALIGSTGADIARFVREIHAHARDHDRAVTLDDVEAVLYPLTTGRRTSLIELRSMKPGTQSWR